MNYDDICRRIVSNGEPGIAWLDNMQSYSRMNGIPVNKHPPPKPNIVPTTHYVRISLLFTRMLLFQDHVDRRARGGNPCLEQTLEPYELCCLVETFPERHESLDDFKRTLKFAYLYAKSVTLGKTHWPETNRVMLRNRRIGCSMSGLAQFITNRGNTNILLKC